MSRVRVGGGAWRVALMSLMVLLILGPVSARATTEPTVTARQAAGSGEKVPPGTGVGRGNIARAPGVDPPAPKYEKPGSSNRTPAQTEYDQPFGGGSRGRTPGVDTLNVGGRSTAPAKQSTKLLNKYPNNGRGLPNPNGKTYSFPRPQMDAFPRDDLGRATGSRVRALRNSVVEGAKSKLPASQTGVKRSARAKVPGIDGYRQRRGDGKCVPLTAGHLVARVFGGYGDEPRNLVPLTQGDNNRMRAQIEDKVRAVVTSNNLKATDFVYYVRAFYDDGTYTSPGQRAYPTRVEGYLELTRGNLRDGTPNYNQTFALDTQDRGTVVPASQC